MVPEIDARVFGQVAREVLGGARKATKFLSPTLTVKAARRHKPDKRATREEILFTVGAPNYAERRFIKLCRKAGEPFPVKKIQIQPYQAKRR